MFKWLILGNERLLMKHMSKGINEIEEVRKHNLWLGRERGLKEGINKEKLSIAKSMKEAGEPIEKIIKFTGIPKNEIILL